MQSILRRYTNQPGNADLVFRSLCALISEQPDQVDWSCFNQNDWALFEKMAVEEGVAPMAYYILRKNPENYHSVAFDTHIYQTLQEQESITTLRNAILFKHLYSVLQNFHEEKIPVVLLKGVDLAQSVYPELGLRRMTDIDLLVSNTRFRDAITIVNQLGYHEYLPEAFPGLDKLISNHAHLRLDGRIPVLLELHWSLVGTDEFHYAPPMEWFWENIASPSAWLDEAQPGNWSYVFVLNPVANLLYLSAHQMLQHGGESLSLQWLLDIHRIVKIFHDDIDWDVLASQANIFGWGSALSSSIKAASNCFNSSLPENLLSLFGSKKSDYSNLVEAKSVRSPTRILGEWKKVNSLGLRGKVLLILALTVPTPAYMRWRYHPRCVWSLPYYYLYRWAVILIDAIRTLFIKVRLLLQKS